jgi:hypothetical protein
MCIKFSSPTRNIKTNSVNGSYNGRKVEKNAVVPSNQQGYTRVIKEDMEEEGRELSPTCPQFVYPGAQLWN